MTYVFQLLEVYLARRGRAAHYCHYVFILLRHHMLYIMTQSILLNLDCCVSMYVFVCLSGSYKIIGD